MDSGDTVVPEAAGPRRTALVQNRSRATRRRLVRVALDLWAARGFETGVEDTTVDEIVQAAGVTKGTFYFHFAHKEDILLELGFASAEVLYEEAERAVASGGSGLAILRRLLNSFARRVESVPRAAVQKSVSGFYSHGLPARSDRLGIQDAFRLALEAARDGGELPQETDVAEVADVIEVVAMDALNRWSRGGRGKLRTVLSRRVAVVINGVRLDAVAATDGHRPAR